LIPEPHFARFVPYRGAAPIMQDLLAGHIDLTFVQVAAALAQVRSGQVKDYAVMAKTRWAEARIRPRSTRKVFLGFMHRFGMACGPPDTLNQCPLLGVKRTSS
jgi:hypothetical protein